MMQKSLKTHISFLVQIEINGLDWIEAVTEARTFFCSIATFRYPHRAYKYAARNLQADKSRGGI